MLNSREVKILEFLIKHGNIPEDEILEKNGINKRVFSYNLQNINIFLKNMGLKKIEKKGEILHFDINQDLKKYTPLLKTKGNLTKKKE